MTDFDELKQIKEKKNPPSSRIGGYSFTSLGNLTNTKSNL